MKYSSVLKKRAIKDLKSVPKADRARVIDRIEQMEYDLSGDVKKLTNHTPEYRMRCGNWRVLFEVEGTGNCHLPYSSPKGRLPVSIHPQIIEKEGKKEFVVIPYDEFVSMQEALADYEDLKALREAKANSESETGTPLASIKAELLQDS